MRLPRVVLPIAALGARRPLQLAVTVDGPPDDRLMETEVLIEEVPCNLAKRHGSMEPLPDEIQHLIGGGSADPQLRSSTSPLDRTGRPGLKLVAIREDLASPHSPRRLSAGRHIRSRLRYS